MTGYVKSLSNAINFDEQKKYALAYHNYARTLNQISKTLVSAKHNEQNQKYINSLIHYSKESISRLSFIFENHYDELGQFSPVKRAPRRKMFIPSPSQSLKVTGNLRNSSNQENSFSELRKQWEDQEISKMNKQIMYQKKMKELNDLKEKEKREGEQFRKTLTKKKGINFRFAWRKGDFWTSFIATNFNYPAMENELLARDKKTIDLINNTIKLTGLNNSLEKEKLSCTNIINVHMNKILNLSTKPTHSLTILLQKFNERVELNNGDKMKGVDVKNIQTDMNVFLEKLLSVLLGRYWKINTDVFVNNTNDTSNVMDVDEIVGEIENEIVECIQNKIFEFGVFKLLARSYLEENGGKLKEKDEKYNSLVKEFNSKKVSLKHFKIKKRLRLIDLKSNSYLSVIRKFKKFRSHHLVEKKLQIVKDCLKDISTCVNEYWTKEKMEKESLEKDDLVVGAEDLVPIFTYCIIKSEVEDMFLEFRFIEDFMDDSSFKGSTGYAIATLETVLNQIRMTDWKELKGKYKEIEEKERKKEMKMRNSLKKGIDKQIKAREEIFLKKKKGKEREDPILSNMTKSLPPKFTRDTRYSMNDVNVNEDDMIDLEQEDFEFDDLDF